ncbi:ribonuclease P protein subunit p20 [Favolaschia claudopus]|uniref:Ribonuclease P protein subunit p20 n=1 Tax=Favolaschia claudopus TaxID=2862362 RepID=A0AAW0CAZ2_9AGAR
MKRRLDSEQRPDKRIRLDRDQARSRPVRLTPPPPTDPPLPAKLAVPPKPEPQRPRINKLTPARPFPTVPTSVSATGPRSAHKEGKNLICITRKTPLGTYLRRCKNVIINDGYKTLHLSAMGAAIPHLLQLVVALPPTLPFAADEIHSTVTTGTMEVQDEVIPDDEDEDITYRTRGKSTLQVVFKIGDGEFEGDDSGSAKRSSARSQQPKNTVPKQPKPPGGHLKAGNPSRMVVAEPDQDDMEI